MENIAVFGGTFNPLHIGHFEIIETLNALEFIDKVIIIPSKIPPHKEVDFLADDIHRKAMCEIAAKCFDKTIVSDLELKREGKSYTVDTLVSLKELYPNSKLHFTIGADMLLSFHTWKEYEKILNLASLICFNRGNKRVEELNKAISFLKTKGAEIFFCENKITDVSSTLIRENISNRDMLSQYIPKDILDYLNKNSVFGE